MKNLFFFAVVLSLAVPVFAQDVPPAEIPAPTPPTAPAPPETPQKPEKAAPSIKSMIASCDSFYGRMAGLLGGGGDQNAEQNYLTGINFPNAVEVSYLAQSQKLGKTRKQAVDQWLKEFQDKAEDRKLYTRETLVGETLTGEGEARYWIISKAEVLAELEAKAKKDDTITLRLRILGFHRKKGVSDYYLLADGLDRIQKSEK